MNDVERAQVVQLQRQAEALMAEREAYVRLTICLVNMIGSEGGVETMDGHPVVRKSAYDAVPLAYSCGMEPVVVKDEEDPEDKGEPGVMVVVTTRQEPAQNGHVLQPEKPRLILP